MSKTYKVYEDYTKRGGAHLFRLDEDGIPLSKTWFPKEFFWKLVEMCGFLDGRKNKKERLGFVSNDFVTIRFMEYHSSAYLLVAENSGAGRKLYPMSDCLRAAFGLCDCGEPFSSCDCDDTREAEYERDAAQHYADWPA